MSSNESSSLASGSYGQYQEGASRPGDPSSTTTSTNSGNHVDSTSVTSSSTKLSKEEQEQLAEKETQMIRRSRICFIMLLMIMAGTAAVLTYHFSSHEESNTFRSEFENYAHEIEQSTRSNARIVHASLNGFGITVTSFSLFGDIVWPNLTLPHFPNRGKALIETSGADLIMLSPVVTTSRNSGWERFAEANHQWIDCIVDLPSEEIDAIVPTHITSNKPRDEILAVHSWISESTGIPLEQIEDIYQVPTWQMFPMEEDDLSKINYDLLSHPAFHRLFHWIIMSHEPVLSEIIDVPALFGFEPHTDEISYRPQSVLIHPIYKGFGDCKGTNCEPVIDDGVDYSQEIGALAVAVLPWDRYLSKLLPQGVNGIYVVLRNTCGDLFSYQINGPEAIFLGEGDHHNPDYDDMLLTVLFDPFHGHSAGYHEAIEHNRTAVNCFYFFDIYPSEELEEVYNTNKPILLTFAVAVIFLFTALVFTAYDFLVRMRQEKVMDSALRSNAIVSSLFPAEVRDRLFSGSKKKRNKHKEMLKRGGLLPSLTEAPKFRLNNFLAENGKDEDSVTKKDPDMAFTLEKPIADLFPSATVLFADICNFTAWSSMRDPAAVFTLLETVYRAFDRVAKRRGVFKVETIGDCYLAVSGLPEPRQDHAVVMAKFARECLAKMGALTTKLEEALGPDTGDLTMRFGLNSGPVTAGVLRGEKSRFQLFGDTVNTAARMESTGGASRIQISEETAQLLREAKKDHWLMPREDKIVAKGKGEMQTYWLHSKEEKHAPEGTSEDLTGKIDDVSHASSALSAGVKEMLEQEKFDAKTKRMVGWIVEILAGLLRQIVAKRKAGEGVTVESEEAISRLEEAIGRGDMTVQEEVTDFVPLPKFNKEMAEQMEDFHQIELKPEILEQLRLYVTEIAHMYRGNPFHSFEHASHVTMSISKLLGRIVAADVAPGEKDYGQGHILARLHDRTYGITSDPLTQFSAVFSGLIHDVDHRGIPNFVLVKEDAELAAMYKCKSVAEQNSVDLAWERLMEQEFKDLRRCIYSTTNELARFRQTVVNTVMATDIFDKDFADLRKRRWETCFHGAGIEDGNNVHRKATIVMEHLIQASDVAHTMQHWQIYRKWNSRLFQEMYRAYRAGRLGSNPSQNWYQSELGFFDNYIIPLAKKLRECGVFGVSSDEYLNYALANRLEWESRGESIIASLLSDMPADPANCEVAVRMTKRQSSS